MAIRALPPSTARLLGSSVKLTSPCDLVKELVDNAVDAGATSIDIAVSANTLDRVTVRDNGCGIEVEDLDLLGRAAHTSKLRSFEELQVKGGATLGFRGDALASANSMAALTVTTRTMADPVATRAQLRPGVGGVLGRRPASAPVGTTIQATELFAAMPARRRPLVKEKQKTLAGIKELLGAYALARPYLRLSFKVAGDGRGSWSYASSPSPSVKEAVLQIFGRGLAASCVSVQSQADASGYVLDAFIPRRDCDVGAMAKSQGIYISVDRRPLSPSSGLPKTLSGILKAHLSEALVAAGLPKPQSSPFMQLSISCPPQSYDPNVSSLKDEVLFADETKLIGCFRSLCQKLYGVVQSPMRPSHQSTIVLPEEGSSSV